MINEDFSIKTGIQVDDSGVSQLKSIANELEKTANALQKINNVKFNGDIFSGLTNAGKSIQNVSKEIDKLQKSVNGAGKPLANIGKGAESIVSGNSKQFTLLDLASIDVIKSNMSEIAASAQNLKKTLGSEVTSGLMTQINEMLAKKDELQNLANILAANKETLDRAGKTAGKVASGSANGSDKTSTYIVQRYKRLFETESEYQRLSSPIVTNTEEENKRLEALVQERKTIMSELNGYMSEIHKAADNSEIAKARTSWLNTQKEITSNFKTDAINDVYTKLLVAGDKKFEGSSQVITTLTSNINSLTDAFNNGKLSSSQYITETQKLFNGFDNTIAQIEPGSIQKAQEVMNSWLNSQLKAGESIKGSFGTTIKENIITTTAEFVNEENQLRKLQIQADLTAGSIKKISESTGISNGKSKGSTEQKYTTNKSYVSDYKTLAKNEAEYQILSQYQKETDEWKAAVVERENILNRVNTISPQNAVETNAKNAYNATVNTVQQNISKYSTQFSNAFSDLDSIKNAKSQVEGISASFAAGEQKVKSWATSVASGKMTIAEFSKNVEGLKTSLNSIYKVITPGSNRETGIASLKSMFTELSGNAKDLVFNPDTSKINNAGEEIVKMSASFKDASGNAKTLTGQVNLATGEVIKLGESTKPLQSGFDKFFGGWKNKVNQLAQFLTSFYALRQAWRVLKEGISIIREFDTALAEMRKVSTESVSSIKNFQKQSFDLADKVGSTALQIQNSTADFLRVGESFKDAQQSAVNANKLLTISEFDNIDDATSALVSLKSAYTDLSEDELINRVNAVGDNFAISTDEVATGLQKAGATLSLLGNSIDESAALITAANTTLQNVDTVAAGVRTISLRIMGTEEAKKELEELGEDTSDYVVETIAKKRQIIKDYTAVASNGGKGIDILDENGNNRNMFDVMKDIGAIYDEIQEEDKKYQTNRAQALIEELAG